jgi:SAM-dependent methyltransferase
MPFLNLFSGHAALYALARPQHPAELFDWIASQAPAREHAWDCGTGNGQAAISLARHFNRVYATAPSQEQISQARRTSNVTYQVEPAEHTSLLKMSVDAICVAQALHWFDFAKFFPEVRRVAKPDALFAAWGYNWFSVSRDFDLAFQESILQPLQHYWAPQNRLAWDAYEDVPFPFHRLDTPRFQISEQWNLRQLVAYVWSWSAMRRYIAERGDRLLESAGQRLVAAWGEPECARLVVMPLHVLAGRVA